ncbi:isoaspartyl peptidase/L-asparaginase [Longimicrobium sp.]|uniref:isoaspartyl peptidase/L-asparaginase family protein n=1 Tax=Longimicrobium sp. TaxID=2029185 RepID=UPI002E2F0901|nr:isoaspartyl peptidase/L-asparaginase [Longimicrobium sp.]HEX6041460.1 isoaspartyl peptidase/L-asparaginase [Longimicrobium sp.]
MIRTARLACLAAVMAAAACTPQPAPQTEPTFQPARPTDVGGNAPAPARWGMVIHGGAGAMTPQSIPPERQAEYQAALTEALMAGHAVLARGGSSLDAVEAAINVMEDNPLFNAGRGAVITADGRIELDAAIMDGATLRAGAVAGLHTVRNPIDLARAVMERSPHVMMIGDGAETFARQNGLQMVEESYFWTPTRRQQWERARQQDSLRADSAARAGRTSGYSVPEERKWGTVGAVALDRNGNLAAGTSTGGMMMKRYGRVGDVPIIGAGTYANNRSCAVSATGHGEFFIRNTVAHSICALMEYGGLPLQAAADSIVMRQLVAQQGEGGIIAMDRNGDWTMPFNSTGMFRGRVGADGVPHVGIFRGEP